MSSIRLIHSLLHLWHTVSICLFRILPIDYRSVRFLNVDRCELHQPMHPVRPKVLLAPRFVVAKDAGWLHTRSILAPIRAGAGCGSPLHGAPDYDRWIARIMVDAFTRRNHYNPCFWTALWNEDYFREYCSDTAGGSSPRDQVVYALNLRAAKVLRTTVEKVHLPQRSRSCRDRPRIRQEILCQVVSGKV